MKMIWLICLVSCISKVIAQQWTWDAFVLSIYWAPGFCYSEGHNCRMLQVVEHFTVHGLWPVRFSGAQVPPDQNAEAYHQFGVGYHPELLGPLTNQWRNYLRRNSDQGFWQIEWEHHGMFSYALFDQVDYFTRGLQLLNRNNILHALQVNGITPGTTATSRDIVQAIRSAIHVDVRLNCRTHNGITFLTEVRICFNRDATTEIHCNRAVGGTCPRHNVYFAPF
nr:ribonuclease S-2-like [Ipomoea batatas]